MTVFTIDVYFDGEEILADCGVCEAFTSDADATTISDWIDVHANAHGVRYIEFTTTIAGSCQALAVLHSEQHRNHRHHHDQGETHDSPESHHLPTDGEATG